jgi:hypothetical protein
MIVQAVRRGFLNCVCGHAVYGVGLWPLARWDFGFGSCRGYLCLCLVNVVCCKLGVSATGRSLIQRSPTKCDASEWMWWIFYDEEVLPCGFILYPVFSYAALSCPVLSRIVMCCHDLTGIVMCWPALSCCFRSVTCCATIFRVDTVPNSYRRRLVAFREDRLFQN